LLAVAATSAKASSEGSAKPAASYLRLPTVTSTVLRRDGRNGVMTVETGVDAHDPALATLAAQSQPRLIAAYNEVVQQMAASLLPDVPPDVDRLSRELQAATNRVLGRPGAILLLGSVMVV